MQPRYYDAAGRIDHEAIKAYANELRHQAICEFWAGLSSRAAAIFAGLRRNAAAHASAIAHPVHLLRSHHRSG
jgi:hypothetical protein